MVQRIGTTQRKTREKFKLGYREKGKISLSRYFQEFQLGDKVSLKIHSNVPHGRFFRRFYGECGEVTGKRGECYKITLKDGNKEKDLFVHPIHLKKQE